MIMANPDISPGCRLCHEGNWLCVYVTRRCTRDCYFCSQEKLKEGEKLNDPIRAYVTGEIRFDDIEEVVRYLKYWKIKGLGISGGEPLLMFDKVCRLISLAKRKIPGIYVWLYTNGDLATKARLKGLRKAGLDEIRFDLAARDYDLGPVRLAGGIIGNVTVETPAIPLDLDRLMASIGDLKQIGVRYLNLHELMVTKENRTRLARAGIKASGSLELARKVSTASSRRRRGIGVNVCSTRYKREAQTRNMIRYMKKV